MPGADDEVIALWLGQLSVNSTVKLNSDDKEQELLELRQSWLSC